MDRRRKYHDLYFEGVSRTMLTIAGAHELDAYTLLKAGDQVKVKVELDAADAHNWRAVQREVKQKLSERGVDVHGIELRVIKSTARMRNTDVKVKVNETPAQAWESFVTRYELGGDALQMGLDILK